MIARMRAERDPRDAILGYLLRELIREDGAKPVLSGIATHAYMLSRDDGKEAARAAGEAAKAEARRLIGDLS